MIQQKKVAGSSHLLHLLFFVFISTLLGLAPAQAVDSLWVGSTDSSWLDPTDWHDSVPNAPGDNARLETRSTNEVMLELPSAITLGQLDILSQASYDLNGVGPLVFDNPGPDPARLSLLPQFLQPQSLTVPVQIADEQFLHVDVAPGYALQLNGGIASPAGDLVKTNTGFLHLKAASPNWAGHLTINGGEVVISDNGALGTGSGTDADATMIHADGTLRFANTVNLASEKLRLNGGRVVDGLNFQGRSTLAGPIELLASSTIGQASTSSSSFRPLSITGTVSGGGNLTLLGQVRLAGDSTYEGETILSGNRTEVVLESSNGLGSTAGRTRLTDGAKLDLRASGSEPILVDGGRLVFQAGSETHDGVVSLQRGVVVLEKVGPSAQPIHLVGNPRGRLTAVLTGAVVWAGGSTGSGDLTMSRISVAGAPLAHEGNLYLTGNNGSVTLDSANSYTGNTSISATNVTVNHPLAFGSASTPVAIELGSRVNVNEVVARDFELIDGELRFGPSAPPYSNTIRFDDGFVTSPGVVSGDIVLIGGNDDSFHSEPFLGAGQYDGTLSGAGSLAIGDGTTLSGNSTYRGITVVFGRLQVNLNSATALGSDLEGTVIEGRTALHAATNERFLMNGKNLDLNVALPHFPHFNPDDGGGTVNINRSSVYDEPILLTHGVVVANVETTFGSIGLSDEAWLQAKEGVVVRSNSENLTLSGGKLEGDIRGLQRIDKRGAGEAEVRGLREFDGEIVVDAGVLKVGDATLPTLATLTKQPSISVNPSSGAALQLSGPVEYDIRLNNSPGNAQGGALRGAGLIGGTLDLGAAGATVGGANTSLSFNGPIIGGDLNISGPGSGAGVTMLSDRAGYTGETRIQGADLELANEGRLSTTSQIVVGVNGRLFLNNSTSRLGGPTPTPINDRIADTIPLVFTGGTLGAWTPESESVTEMLGSVSLERGSSEIYSQDSRSSNGASTEFAIKQLNRFVGATLEVNMEDLLAVRLEQTPVLDDGLLGSWVTTTWLNLAESKVENDFATYDATGVAPLTTFQTNWSAATANDNVLLELSPATASADKQINSLTIREDSQNILVDLGGHRLNVESGGILFHGGSLSNGQLTAQGSGDSELVLHGRGEVGADIVDGDDGPLSVVVAPARHSRAITLSGENRYSGPTHVNNRAELTLGSEGALPLGTDLIINGGTVYANHTNMAARQLGTLILRDGGRLTDKYPHDGHFDFELMEVESGSISEIGLSGDGTLRKTTAGVVTLFSRRSQDYTGNVEVHAGTLEISGSESFGNADFTVHNGRLTFLHARNDSRLLNSSIKMLGGELAIGGNFEGVVDVLAPTRIVATDRSRSAIENFRGSHTLTLATEDSLLVLPSDNDDFSGNVVVEGFIITQAQNAFGTGDISIPTGGTLELSELAGSLANNISLAGGTIASDWNDSQFPPTLTLTGNIALQEDSVIRTNSQTPIHIVGLLSLPSGSRLTKHGEGLLQVSGDVLVGEQVEIVSGPGFLRQRNSDQKVYDVVSQLELTGRLVSNADAATLNIVRTGFDDFVFDASLHIPLGQSFLLTEDGQSLALDFHGTDRAVSGGGTLLNPVTIADGATLSPGALPGTLNFGSSLTLGAGSIYEWKINDALGTAGRSAGWDLLQVDGEIVFDATEQMPFTLEVIGLDSSGVAGIVESFDASQNYRWLIASANSITGFDASLVQVDASNFLSNLSVSPETRFSLEAEGGSLYLVHGVPEPTSCLLAIVGLVGLLGYMLTTRYRSGVLLV